VTGGIALTTVHVSAYTLL